MKKVKLILLIDDDHEDQIIFKHVLSKITKDIECACVSNGKTGIETARAMKVLPDVIF
ncbi:MAG: hypothetical protein H0W73_18840 [Bacteroidetes bacterium]|nr:hypothetical protein [Bacteroidota bacterium]